jgi:hypothetical protein
MCIGAWIDTHVVVFDGAAEGFGYAIALSTFDRRR